jgi:Ferritin-like domain
VTTGLSRAGFLKRGALGCGALLVSTSGLAAFAEAASADTLPDGDLAYLRLLIAAELLAVDFQGRALASGKLLLRDGAHPLFRRIRADEKAHYAHLAALLTGAGQTPATSADINFAYPKGTFRSQGSIVKVAVRIERVMVGAYVGAADSVETSDVRLAIAQIAANEAQHASGLAVLSGGSAIGKAFAPALSIGAVSDALDEFES